MAQMRRGFHGLASVCLVFPDILPSAPLIAQGPEIYRFPSLPHPSLIVRVQYREPTGILWGSRGFGYDHIH